MEVKTLESVKIVRLDRGGYGPDGRYWGGGSPLWCLTFTDGSEDFARASTVNTAVTKAIKAARWDMRYKVHTLTLAIGDNEILLPMREKPLEWQKQGLRETATGYGSRLTTTKQVYFNGRWMRVYCACWSNAGICYIGPSKSWIGVIRD